jgi:AraC-like DNA-binding protein
MTGKAKRRAGIRQLDYHPSTPYPLDLEIFSASDLRRRVRKERLRSTHRYAFHVLMCITHGTCTHLLDFKPIHCEPGSLLTWRPGQTHSFGLEEDWDGWMILFRPEFLLPSPAAAPDLKLVVGLERLPEHLSLRDPELRSVTDAVAQMREDARIDAPPKDVHALLRYQLYALLLRLSIFHDRQEVRAGASTRALQRFKHFQQLVEQNFAKWHQVANYAEQLGCAEKSLTRATMQAAGMNAKAFIASRISLEAKRLLVHTDLSVTLIAESLGFEEATNFIKFFKREAGCTPAEFRRQQDVVSVVYGSSP